MLATRGTLKPVVAKDALGVGYQDGAGATVLDYAGLKVWDADGKVLASRFEAAGEKSVRLVVDDRGARYPLTIDPVAQQAYLKASNTGYSDQFGYSVAVSGDTVVVGALAEDSSTRGVNSTPNESAQDSGAAYVSTVAPPFAPTVGSPTSGSLTSTSATLGGNVTSDGGASITERGVVYSVTSVNNNPLISGTGVTKVIEGATTTGVFTTAVTGLTGSTGYSSEPV